MKDKKSFPKPKPTQKWQTGSYSRQANFNLTLPYQFLVLCKLMDITPETIIKDFAVAGKEKDGIKQKNT